MYITRCNIPPPEQTKAQSSIPAPRRLPNSLCPNHTRRWQHNPNLVNIPAVVIEVSLHILAQLIPGRRLRTAQIPNSMCEVTLISWRRRDVPQTHLCLCGLSSSTVSETDGEEEGRFRDDLPRRVGRRWSSRAHRLRVQLWCRSRLLVGGSRELRHREGLDGAGRLRRCHWDFPRMGWMGNYQTGHCLH